jgi:hypothetical protein
MFVTASVLFAWVDLYDLVAVLELSLSEVAKKAQLLQEKELRKISLREGRYLMEEMLYRAQMEVSLFSKAIVNLCEEVHAISNPRKACFFLKTIIRHLNLLLATQHPHPTDLFTVNAAVGVYRAPSFHCFQPTQATQEKCDAWLLSLHSQDTTHGGFDAVGRTLLDSPRTLALHKHLLRVRAIHITRDLVF